jgi:ribonuclease P protein component
VGFIYVCGAALLKFTQPLKKNSDFKNIFGNGAKAANRLLVMYAMPNQAHSPGRNRLGISVSKKVGKAVTRNRVKRLIKENYRLLESRIKTDFDITITARAEAGMLPKKKMLFMR